MFLDLLQIVGEEHPLNILFCIGGVVELHPVVLLTIFVDVDGVSRADFVDTDGMQVGILALGVGHLAIGGHEIHGAIGQVDFCIGGEIVIAIAFTEVSEERCIEVDVARRGGALVYLHADKVRTFLEE